MPRYAPRDIAHTAATDHRILRRPDDPTASPRAPRELGIVPFYRPRPGADDAGAGRDLGIALVRILVQGTIQHQAPPVGPRAVSLLEAALRNDPGDLPAWEARAEALALLDRPAEAGQAYEAILARDPHREAALMGAATLAQQQRLAAAAALWHRAVAEGPWQPAYRASLAQVLADQKAWDEARTQAEAWVRLDPANLDARVLYVTCLARSGHKDAARAEFARIERLRPPNLPVLRARFTVELRQR
jgi:tetratricopeptide (TPR) repeat protein